MSGHKRATITISESEYRRLHDAEMRLRFAPPPPVEATRLYSDQVNLALQEHISQLEERQQQFEWTVQNFEESARAAELQTVQLYMQREAELYRRLTSELEHRLEDTRELLADQAAEFESRLEEERRSRQAQMSRVEAQWEQVLDASERKYQSAMNWLAQAREIDQFIHKNYNHEMFLPGELERFEQAIFLAETNLSEGMPEAALSGGQQAYLGLSELHLQLERLQGEWRLLLETCWENAACALAHAQENQTCTAHDLDGNEVPDQIDVNFWTQGDLEKQIQDLQTLKVDLHQRSHEFDLQALQTIAQELPQRQEQLNETIYQARLAFLNSQLRINIAEWVVEELQSKGFSLVEWDYSDGDQRTAFSARVSNRERDEVVVQVSPDPYQLGKNELHLYSLDQAWRDERELYQRSQEVTASLGERGLDVGQIRSTQPGNPRRAHDLPHSKQRQSRAHDISR